MAFGLPKKDGLYDPANERDACGVGFVANIDGRRTHNIVEKGIEILVNLMHRGAAGSDPETGDGAGLLLQVPDGFFRHKNAKIDFEIPEVGQYGVGMIFLPTDPVLHRQCVDIIEQEAATVNCPLIGWREVPVDKDMLGEKARLTCPAIKQIFLGNPGFEADAFERTLYVLRRSIENRVAECVRDAEDHFYIPSLSSRVIGYKGLMLAHQVRGFYTELADDAFESALALVHQRYSTNTFPTWPLAQPFRLAAHNGEINTLRGNINNMRARYSRLTSEFFGKDELEAILPVIIEGGSDSACFDNQLELLVMAGRSLPHAMMMMVPEAWGERYYMGADRRAFFEYHSMFQEPWDGPAALVATDGVRVCAALDRNGLRPARYMVTRDGLIVLASEVGVLDYPDHQIESKGRLSPGKMLMVDTELGRLLGDEEIKATVCRRQPYRRWVEANRIRLRGLFDGTAEVRVQSERLLERQTAFGYSREDVNELIAPMAATGKEPVGSMGDDAPLAVLSQKPQLLFNYFKQLFAQVTNPAIDPIRERLVMSLTTYLGRQGNLLSETPQHARMLRLRTPILTNDDLARLRTAGASEFNSVTIDMLFDKDDGPEGLEAAVEDICRQAEERVREGSAVVILSDRGVSSGKAPIPSLLAAAAVNHHLVRKGLRTLASIVVESGEVREVMHFSLLLGYGASAINPYLAMETIATLVEQELLPEETTVQDALENYSKAIEEGLLKIFSKMGISTLRSYRSAQIFEVLGLSEKLVSKYFTDTPTRIDGIGAAEIARETLERHAKAYVQRRAGPVVLDSGGRFRVRTDGERHLWTPESIRHLQQATRRNDAQLYSRFAKLIDDQENRHCTLRSLFDFVERKPIDIDEVEPVSAIVKRFVTGAMSFGSISREAHESLAIAMNRLGGRSNSGEGGEDRRRYKSDADGNNRCSATKQVASGRFGVTAEFLVNASELQIKVAQGAKPGEGGQLPGHKVNREIAAVRHSTPGVSLISPPPHHDIYSIEDLAQLIFDLKNINSAARINVKLVSEVGVGAVAAGVSKGHADAVLISGGDGGTGASPLSSIKYAGIPWELGLAETQQVLVANDLRGRIRVQTDGQMRTGRDVAIAALLGAEEFGFATTPLIVLGCVMMRKCHKNTCPVGVATQDPELRKRFTGKPEYIVNYFHFVAQELRAIMAQLGFRTVDEMVGRSDLLKLRDGISHSKAAMLDFSNVFRKPPGDNSHAVRNICVQDHGLDGVLDRKLIETAALALDKGDSVKAEFPIRNTDRATGVMLSGEVAKRFGHEGLPDDTIIFGFKGSAGQSFAAFLAHGVTFRLVGDANDYVGKGLSGGKILVHPPADALFDPGENVVVGNVALYGATGGEAYLNGLGGERFAIRNSGAVAVVEGLGDHGCEYMTGGIVAVLGRTGVNFAAGMSGGIAYVYDPRQDFDLRCNLDMVDLEAMKQEEDINTLKALIETHIRHTGSAKAKGMLENWERTLSLFVKVMPIEYRRALGQMREVEKDARRTESEVVQLG